MEINNNVIYYSAINGIVEKEKKDKEDIPNAKQEKIKKEAEEREALLVS